MEEGLHGLVDGHRLVVACGAGGVGKTTIAAAVGAAAAARSPRRVLVLTVDPARRLASALGMRQLGNVEVRVPAARFTEAGRSAAAAGELWVAMLDTKQSWDDLVRRHAPDARTRDAILANPLYRNLTAKFVASHDYIAAERLHELDTEGRYDLVVVDTPPSRNAVDFLDAPARMAEFFSSRLLRWLIAPYRSRLVTAASKPFFHVADRVLGAQFLADIAEFFILFRTMYDGFVERSRAVERTLHDRGTSFLLVSTLEAAPAREAELFAAALAERRYRLGGVVLNRTLPEGLTTSAAAASAATLRQGAPSLGQALAADVGADAEDVARVLREVADGFANLAASAADQERRAARLEALRPEALARAPVLDRDLTDLAGLLALADLLGA
ncbi:MAG: AAA family ATPase [Acidimicrobiia bacterium]|nr:AAA family ATPase [Acidimicrobiia bacterium]